MENNQKLIVGIAAGACAGAALGYVMGKRHESHEKHETQNGILETVTNAVLNKGIDVLTELQHKYGSHSESRQAN